VCSRKVKSTMTDQSEERNPPHT